MQIIGVNFKYRDSDDFQTKVYSYYCSIEDVKVGDLVNAPTRDGESIVRVCDVGVDPATIDKHILAILKTIETRADDVVEVVDSVPAGEGTELISIVQLPIITEELHSIKAQVTAKVDAILAMPCTEDTVKEIKRMRADLNKDFKELDDKRKLVKREVLRPFEAFESIFKECVSDPFAKAEAELKTKIFEVEDGMKGQKRETISAYYGECLAAHELDFPSFAKAGIKIGLSDSESKLKKQVDSFIEGIAGDVAMIRTLPHADEIMVEYRASLNTSHAIMTVNNRHKAIEEERARNEQPEPQAPTVAPEPQPVVPIPEPEVPHVIVKSASDEEKTMTIKVTGNQRQIDRLMQYLDESWYTYTVLEV